MFVEVENSGEGVVVSACEWSSRLTIRKTSWSVSVRSFRKLLLAPSHA